MPLFDVNPDIAFAKTIATDFYLNPSYYELSKEKIFAATWQLVGDTDQVKEPGWVTPVSLLEKYIDEPLLLSRDKQGDLHCLSNVCTHRGNLLVERPCKLNDMRCKYHGRRFQLDGKFLSMPEFKEVANFPTEDDNLTKLPLHTFGKWLFTSLHPTFDADKFLGDMMKRVGWMPFQEFQFRPELSRDYVVDAHWALYCENYLEGFHIPFVHAGLNAVIDYGNYTTELFPYSNLQVGYAKDDDAIFELPPASPDFGKKIAGYYFWVFPNMMFNFYPWGLSINVVRPVGLAKSKISFLSYVWDENKLRQGAGANLHQVEMEDEDVVRHVQKGIRSRFYKHGRYSVKMEKGTHHFHRLIAEFIN
ncbi:aromatic ring-hydroxylating oxygenase subunit alpha [Chryseolinea lacunae]|uniref:Aromatic ring-hydroxylating dioxygenase subunit alpha n=1 Tax=Chryseolinea lacunae TaxID=2801331 RepID=A0ABS1L1Z1_9BACT|nr:aromatic ring-hydroxylating dioxygenase subunit alpha [Chryseolinea lacunae]MBL0744952.1 aromatic ring-hydroxylating dioxygenase subunit alpha [Chryseolinea lacunae]